jgi:hypothetical protein
MRTVRSGKYSVGDDGTGAALRPYTLPEMFAISVKPARLSAVGRFHNG